MGTLDANHYEENSRVLHVCLTLSTTDIQAKKYGGHHGELYQDSFGFQERRVVSMAFAMQD